MILLHHPEVELSRDLLAALPKGCSCVDWTISAQREEYIGLNSLAGAASAFPTVIVGVPAYVEDRPLFAEDGSFLGMAQVTVPEHQEALRMPGSWDAVASFVAHVEARARLSPAG